MAELSDKKFDALDEAIKDVLSRFCDKDEEDNFYTDAYTDYNTEGYILEEMNRVNPQTLEEFNDMVNDMFWEQIPEEEYQNLIELCKYENIKEAYKEATAELANIFGCQESHLFNMFGDIEPGFLIDYIRDYSSINFYVNVPDFTGINICVDICIDTGDMNYDYVLNDIFPHYDGTIEDIPQKEASLLWLAETQGYSGKELFEYLVSDETSDNKFLKSIYEELLNCGTHMNQVTFLVKMPLWQYFECNSTIDRDNKAYYVVDRAGKGFITVSKETMCGLHDFWSGAGGGMDIKLQNDVQIPISCMSNLRYEINGKTNYDECSIQDVYGTNDVWWDFGKVLQVDYETPCTYIPKDIELNVPSLDSEAKDMEQAAESQSKGQSEREVGKDR